MRVLRVSISSQICRDGPVETLNSLKYHQSSSAVWLNFLVLLMSWVSLMLGLEVY